LLHNDNHRRQTQALASHWRERETEREGPAFVPTDVDDIALNEDGLFLVGHKGGSVTYASPTHRGMVNA
jgi:hypothetical protein